MVKRRRGSRLAERRPRARHERFDVLVGRAVAAIPQPFRAALDEIAIVIADEPDADQRRENELGPDDTLYGLYEGVSGINYGADWAIVANKITIFRLPLEEDYPDPQRLAREVQRTVLHEIGHHAGLGHARLRKTRVG